MPSLRRGGPHVVPCSALLRDVTHRPRRLGQLAGDDRAELDHGVVAAALDPARPYHHAALVEAQVRAVEDERLADLGVRGSMPSEATVERRSESGTVSSTLSAWLVRASISSS
jgi:hypothetical protein